MAGAGWRYSVGVDLGQAQDYTALAVVERRDVDTGDWETLGERREVVGHTVLAAAPIRRRRTRRDYDLRHLERVPLGTPYPAIVARVRDLMTAPPLATDTLLTVDATGVGRPVIDLLRAARLPVMVTPVTITGGDAVSRGEGWSYRVPKRDLVGGVQVLLQSERLKVAKGLPHAETFVQELLAFRVKITDAAHATYGVWREGHHDDLVLAVALACWRAENPPINVVAFY